MGPVMIGPSSSHTAGAVRIGKVASALLGERVINAEIEFHGSFADTYRGHGTDKAIMAGIMTMNADDERIPDSLSLARKMGIEYSIQTVVLLNVHPNTARVSLIGESQKKISMEAASVGGGSILVTKIDGIAVSFSGEMNTLIISHIDKTGIIAEVTKILAEHHINIAKLQCSRTDKGSLAVMTIEVDNEVNIQVVEAITRQKDVTNCVLIKKIE